jgi:hypothetical protein
MNSSWPAGWLAGRLAAWLWLAGLQDWLAGWPWERQIDVGNDQSDRCLVALFLSLCLFLYIYIYIYTFIYIYIYIHTYIYTSAAAAAAAAAEAGAAAAAAGGAVALLYIIYIYIYYIHIYLYIVFCTAGILVYKLTCILHCARSSRYNCIRFESLEIVIHLDLATARRVPGYYKQ